MCRRAQRGRIRGPADRGLSAWLQGGLSRCPQTVRRANREARVRGRSAREVPASRKDGMMPQLAAHGVVLVRNAVSTARIARWREIAEQQYAWIAATEQAGDLDALRNRFPPGQYLPGVSSLRLDRVYAATDWQEMLNRLAESAAGA